MSIKTVFLFALSTGIIVHGFDYCKVKGCEEGSHTLCVYPDPDNIKCEGALSVGLTQAQRNIILDQHNQIRQRLANGNVNLFSGANIMKMKWNSEMEPIAQRWANNLPCEIEYNDGCRSTQDGVACGQNVGVTYINKKTHPIHTIVVLKSLNVWDAEQDLLQNEYTGAFFAINMSSMAHFTQVIWWSSSEIGCGLVIRKGDEVFSPVVLVCNYKPAGNIDGHPMYEKGYACSKCPKGTHCSKRYPGLCTGEVDENKDLPEEPESSTEFALKPSLLIVAIFQYITITLSY